MSRYVLTAAHCLCSTKAASRKKEGWCDGTNNVIEIDSKYYFRFMLQDIISFFARAKRMYHVCLGVSHERECFQEIAAGLSYKAVKLYLFGLRAQVAHMFKPRLRSRSIPKDC